MLRKFPLENCRPIDTTVAQIPKTHMPHSLHSCTYVFVKNDPIKSNLTPTYDGPFQVLSRTEKTFTILRGVKQQSVAINNVKPAYCSSSSFEEPPVAETFPTPQNSTRLPRQHVAPLLDFVTT